MTESVRDAVKRDELGDETNTRSEISRRLFFAVGNLLEGAALLPRLRGKRRGSLGEPTRWCEGQ
jgi:hypothetical protein